LLNTIVFLRKIILLYRKFWDDVSDIFIIFSVFSTFNTLNMLIVQSFNWDLTLCTVHFSNIVLSLNVCFDLIVTVKQSKNKFKTQKVKFLNYVIWSEHIKKDSEKIVIIRDWLILMRFKKVQIFLKLVNYYWKFILNYSQIAKSLT